MKRNIAIINSIALAVSLALSSSALASGFQLYEESAAGTGDYHAGGAAEANDASTEFYNPAGMVRLKHQQVSAGGVYIPLKVNFKGTVASTQVDANGDTNNFVPNFHYVLPLPKKFVFGFGVTTPFGLKTKYPTSNNKIKEVATLTQLKTININPNLAYAINDHLSVGLGFNAQYNTADFDEMLGSYNDTNHFTGWGFGYNLGVLYQFSPHTRLGLSYRSKIHYNAKGTGTFGPLADTTITSSLTLPATTTLSLYHDITSKWAAMASIAYTQWNVIQSIVIKNTPAGDITAPYHYKNTFNFALGVHYKINQMIMLKAGTGYDQSPTQDQYRDVRMPDVNRYAAAIGAQFTLSNHFVTNIGWTHFFIKDAPIDNLGVISSSGSIPSKGIARMQANVFGLQITWTA